MPLELTRALACLFRRHDCFYTADSHFSAQFRRDNHQFQAIYLLRD